MKTALLTALLLATPALAQSTAPLQMGYYAGPATMYPYDPVYCKTDDDLGECVGVYIYVPKSAPLPPYEKSCRWVDVTTADPNKGWYVWAPRLMPPERAKYLGERVCYLEDKGAARDLQEIQRSEAAK